MSRATYASRESVKAALDAAETARNNAQIDRCLRAGADTIEGPTCLNRSFLPRLVTRYFAWPDVDYGRPWTLRLGRDEFISVTTLTAGGVEIASTDYFLEPANAGPPYREIQIDLASSAAFTSNPGTTQRSISVYGLAGYRDDESAAGALENAVSSSSVVAIDVTNSAAIGVGNVIRIDTERMIVAGKSMLDTQQNTGSTLAAANNAVSLTVTTGSAYAADEIIQVDAEKLRVVEVTGNVLTVQRAVDGSVLAAHSANVDIYAPRTLTVLRGQLGTDAATHADAAPIYRFDPPDLVQTLNLALAMDTLLQEGSGYARTAGTGESAREYWGRALGVLLKRAENFRRNRPYRGAV